jgi:hypothetical protein
MSGRVEETRKLHTAKEGDWNSHCAIFVSNRHPHGGYFSVLLDVFKRLTGLRIAVFLLQTAKKARSC